MADNVAYDMGPWLAVTLGAVGGILTVVWLARQLWVSFSKSPVPSELFITRAELDRELSGLAKLRDQQELGARVTELSAYSHKANHEFRDLFQKLTMDVELLKAEMSRRLDTNTKVSRALGRRMKRVLIAVDRLSNKEQSQ